MYLIPGYGANQAKSTLSPFRAPHFYLPLPDLVYLKACLEKTIASVLSFFYAILR
jgi:hypothetical protein